MIRYFTIALAMFAAPAPAQVAAPLASAAEKNPSRISMAPPMQAAGKNGAMPLADCRASRVIGAYRVIETWPSSVNRRITCDGLVGEDIAREGIRLQGTVEDVIIRNFRLNHASAANRGRDLPECIHVQSGTRILIENGVCSGFRTHGMKYANGDGIAVEKGVSFVTIRRVTAIDNSDAAFDILKGSDILLDDVTGERSGRCLKTGAVRVRVTKITCRAMSKAGIEVHGNDVRIGTFIYDVAGSTAAPWLLSVTDGKAGTASLTIDRCILTGPFPAKTKFLVKGPNTTVNLGPGCQLPR